MKIELKKITKQQWIKITAGALALLLTAAVLFALRRPKPEAPPAPPSRLDVFLTGETKEIVVYDDAELRTLPIEDYLMGVVAREMPLSFGEEALKAQAVAARTYTLRKMADGGCGREGADICTDHTHCQAYAKQIPQEYQKKVRDAVTQTRGKVAVHEGYPIKAMYHSTAGEKTEDNRNVFGDEQPYLLSVDSPGEKKYKSYQKTVRIGREEGKKKVRELRGELTKDTISIRELNGSGRVKEADLFGHYFLGTQVRTLFGLPSTNFTVERQGESYVFTCIGYGHGVGMSQVGADARAAEGKTHEDILHHYYTGIELKRLYE